MDERHHSSGRSAAPPRRSVRADAEPQDCRVTDKSADAVTQSPGRRTSALADVRQLQNCLNDLVSVLALPAMWRNQEPPEILHILIDALVGMLRLDFAYGWLKTQTSVAPLEIVRVAERCVVNESRFRGRRAGRLRCAAAIGGAVHIVPSSPITETSIVRNLVWKHPVRRAAEAEDGDLSLSRHASECDTQDLTG